MTAEERLNVLVVGGGVAGLETALALRELANDRVSVTLLAPQGEFVYRPMTVREPFGFPRAHHYSLEDIGRDLGAAVVQDSLESIDPEQRLVHTADGLELSYDALVLALGAEVRPAFNHATTIDDRQIDEQLHGLIQDIEEGYVRSVAFLAPSPMPWPLPMYELALMTSRRAYDMNMSLAITVVTPEDAPLAVFGPTVSDGIEKLLEEHGVTVMSSAHADVPEPHRVAIHPGDRSVEAQRIVALPQLSGPEIAGLPTSGPDGFIPVDETCRVRGVDRVWAAGDATDFPVKLGGIAAQQADTAAAEIAALAGVQVEPHPFHPEIRAILVGGRKPLYLSAHITGGQSPSSELSDTPSWSPMAKIAARYLGPYLESRDRATGQST